MSVEETVGRSSGARVASINTERLTVREGQFLTMKNKIETKYIMTLTTQNRALKVLKKHTSTTKIYVL